MQDFRTNSFGGGKEVRGVLQYFKPYPCLRLACHESIFFAVARRTEREKIKKNLKTIFRIIIILCNYFNEKSFLLQTFVLIWQSRYFKEYSMKMIKKLALLSAVALLTSGFVFASGKKDVEEKAKASAESVKETTKESAEAVKDAAKDAVDTTVTAAKDAAKEGVEAAEESVNKFIDAK